MGQAPRRRSLPAGVRDRTTPDCDGERRASLSGRPICEAAGALCCIPAAPQDRVGGGNDPARRSGSQRTAVSDARPRLVPTAIVRGEVSQSPPRTRTHSPRALFSAFAEEPVHTAHVRPFARTRQFRNVAAPWGRAQLVQAKAEPPASTFAIRYIEICASKA